MSKILIIEDNFQVRDNLAEILELDGFIPIQANDGKEGVRLAYEHLPDLIICDVMMPELDGFGVMKILQKSESTKHIPVIFLTAKAEMADLRKGMTLGAADYLTKPFDDSELLEVINRRISKYQSRHKSILVSEKIGNLHINHLLKNVLPNAEVRKYEHKEFLYRAGKQPYFLYFIKSGLIKITIENELGKSVISNIYGKNQLVGLTGALKDEPYRHHAICMREAEVAIISKDDFLVELQNNLTLTSFLLQSLSTSIENSNQKINTLAYGSMRYKVAQALIYLKDIFQDTTITVSRDEIAELSGTARESTIRTLSEFKANKLLAIKGSVIKILELDKLKEIPF